MCSMCEAHINDAVRNAFPVKKVTSSHSHGETVILCEKPLAEDALKNAIDKTGYTMTDMQTEVYRKKGLLSFLK